MLISIGVSVPSFGADIKDVVAVLADTACRCAEVKYEVLLPTAADPVTYDIRFLSYGPADSLSACNYLVDWYLPHAQRTSRGFCAYADGNHYRYRDTRLQEYHFANDPAPFLTEKGGVAATAQFADLMPQYLARNIENIMADSTYSKAWDSSRATLTATRRIGGYDALTLEYRFDPVTLLPVQLETEYNPASISEQTVTATYSWLPPEYTAISENMLEERYPEVFEKYRTSTFRVENIIGTSLPAFTAMTPKHVRYARNAGEPMSSPSLLVFLDAGSAEAHKTVNTVLSATLALPYAPEVLLLFADTDGHAISTATAEVRKGATVLMGAGSLFRRCGITACPTILFVNMDGTIADLQVGSNQDLENIVIQKTTLLR